MWVDSILNVLNVVLAMSDCTYIIGSEWVFERLDIKNSALLNDIDGVNT